MADEKFYSVVVKKFVTIPKTKCKKVVKNGREFLVGKYNANGKEYEAWRVLGMAKKKAKK